MGIGGESYPTLIDVTIANNEGGGIFLGSSSGQKPTVTLKNVTIVNNLSYYTKGGGISCHGANLYLDNVTISNNTTEGSYGGGIYFEGLSGSCFIKNSIITGNSGGFGLYIKYGDLENVSISYSNFWNNESGNFFNCNEYLGKKVKQNLNGDSCDVYNNIFLDPEFEDVNFGNYQLSPNSPCIDAGDPDLSILDPDSTIIDMGAYPFNQLIPYADFSAILTNTTYPLEVEFTDESVVGLGGKEITQWYWDFGDGSSSILQNPVHVYQNPGYYTVRLTVTDDQNNNDTQVRQNFLSVLTDSNNLKDHLKWVNIYPNPSNGLFQFVINKLNQEEFWLEVINITGKVVFAEEYKNNVSHQVEQLDLSQYPTREFIPEFPEFTWLCGAPVIMSNIPPYNTEVKHNERTLLCKKK